MARTIGIRQRASLVGRAEGSINISLRVINVSVIF